MKPPYRRTPRIPHGNALKTVEDCLDLCFIAVRPSKEKGREKMLRFLQRHCRPWFVLSGEPSVAERPCAGLCHGPQRINHTIEFHYTPDISDFEQQYIASVARWTALRVGHVSRRTIGKVSETARMQGARGSKRRQYRTPCIYYNGHEKWMVVEESQWKETLSPEEMGVGSLCDEHGFRSQDPARKKQLLHHVQDLNGLVTPHARHLREMDQIRESIIYKELRRLSERWGF